MAGRSSATRRVVVTGSSGSGKTTFARTLAGRLDVPHVELDSLHHLPDWATRPREQFRTLVDDAAPPGGGWVVDGNYHDAIGDLVWPRADAVVFLDLPRWRVMAQLVPRTLRRLLTREELWHGNRERLHTVLSRDPDRNVMLWSWRNHERYRQLFDEAVADPRWDDIELVRISDRAGATAVLDDCRPRRSR